MSNYIAGFDPALTYSTEDHALGTEATLDDGRTFIFSKANGAVVQYRAVEYNSSRTEAREVRAGTASTEGAIVAVAQIAVADEEFFWGLRDGEGRVDVGASCGAESRLYTTATAGRLDDTSSSQSQIVDVVLTSARGNTDGDSPCLVHFPSVAIA